MRAGKEVRLKMTHGEDKACKERESRSCPPPNAFLNRREIIAELTNPKSRVVRTNRLSTKEHFVMSRSLRATSKRLLIHLFIRCIGFLWCEVCGILCKKSKNVLKRLSIYASFAMAKLVIGA